MGQVLIIDDEPAVLRIWERVLKQDGWDVLTAENAATARQHLQDVEDRQFDVVLLDLHLPDGDGAELLDLIQQYHPEARVAVVSAYLDAKRSMDIQQHGVMSIPKPLQPASLQALVANLASPTGSVFLVVDSFAKARGLSGREADVLRHTVAGLSNKEIADYLGCKKRTVDTYWNRIFTKTSCRSQRSVLAALVRFACESLPR